MIRHMAYFNIDSDKESWILDLGICDFDRTLNLQRKIHQMRVNNKIPDTMILVEHPPVITFGKSSDSTNLLVSSGDLAKKRIKIFQIERGGDVTFHGPGQLVGYPIFHIKDALAGIKGTIKRLESALILTLRDFMIKATVKPELVGVWVNDDKIASIGIAVKKWVTFHGFALNVATDLSYFDLIRPCGLTGVRMTSMEKLLGKKVNIVKVKESTKLNFEKVFFRKFTMKENLDEFTA
jgi:lipoate-protein ligase B